MTVAELRLLLTKAPEEATVYVALETDSYETGSEVMSAVITVEPDGDGNITLLYEADLNGKE